MSFATGCLEGAVCRNFSPKSHRVFSYAHFLIGYFCNNLKLLAKIFLPIECNSDVLNIFALFLLSSDF